LQKSEFEIESLRKELMQFVELSKKVESDYAKIQNELTVCQKRLSVLEVEKTKLLLKLKEKEEAIITLNE
jgi:predicted  nucleic acid-binding Zn-ribbon protein